MEEALEACETCQ